MPPRPWPSLPSCRKVLVILYLLANLKSLPFVWHLRVLYHFITNLQRTTGSVRISQAFKSLQGTSSSTARNVRSHPLFAPVSLYTRTPLLEADYNLHKSNSTYFSDMDISRTKVVTRLVSLGMKKSQIELERQGYKGRMIVVLGSVHVSFRREVKMYEKIEIRSRVLGWDAKWLVVASYFVRRKAGNEELCAVGLSKYVCKKGRYTVKPDMVLGLGGWLPERRDGEGKVVPDGVVEEPRTLEDAPPSISKPEHGGEAQEESEAQGPRSAQVPEVAERIVLDSAAAAAATSEILQERQNGWDADGWTWEEIEEERLRGMKLTEGWLALDTQLYDDFGV